VPPQQQQPQQGMTLDEKLYTLVAIGQFIEKPAVAFLRVPGTAGCQYFGFHAMAGLFLMLLWITTWNPLHAQYAFWANVAMLVIHKIAGRWGDPTEHSHYNGYPWLSQILRLNELTCKAIWEPLLLGLIGLALHSVSPGLAYWLWLSGAGLVVANAYIRMRDNSIDRARTDALATQRTTMQRWQEAAQPFAPRQGSSRFFTLLVLAVLASGGWLLYAGKLHFPASLAAWMPRTAPLTEEEKARLELDAQIRQGEMEWRAEQARDAAIRRAWRRRNEQAGFYY
jgi:hypothetical protein